MTKAMALPPHQPARFTISCTTEDRSGLFTGTSTVVSGTSQLTLVAVLARVEISPAVVVKVGVLSSFTPLTTHCSPLAPVWVLDGVSTSVALVTVAPCGMSTVGKRNPTS